MWKSRSIHQWFIDDRPEFDAKARYAIGAVLIFLVGGWWGQSMSPPQPQAPAQVAVTTAMPTHIAVPQAATDKMGWEMSSQPVPAIAMPPAQRAVEPKRIAKLDANSATNAKPATVKVGETIPVAWSANTRTQLPSLWSQPTDAVYSPDRSLNTALRWAKSPAEAAQQARAENKLVFLIHVSGNFEDPGFT